MHVDPYRKLCRINCSSWTWTRIMRLVAMAVSRGWT